jgi:hypothetical protein
MSDFVEQCRREWKRLNVPDLLADEMAGELDSDLAAAEAEGMPAEEFLGNSLSDPRLFAASWAAERGVIPVSPTRGNARWRPLVLAAFSSLAVIAVIVTAAALLMRGRANVEHLPSVTNPPHLAPPGGGHVIPRQVGPGNTSGQVEWIVLFLAVVALGLAAWLWSSRVRRQPPTVPA